MHSPSAVVVRVQSPLNISTIRFMNMLIDFLLCCSADEVPAPAAEVSGVSGGREGSRSTAGAQSRTHTPEVQH